MIDYVIFNNEIASAATLLLPFLQLADRSATKSLRSRLQSVTLR
ncbi:hypothetical protein LT85_3654 [Collimonas arenae]|uniref:Uncharacterized protein n=1 Tax=Collimonas arenae TaxID=279058 RepID=A0A0A1FIX6_9BURK|nr:hypothetical protein LT85_3654 [Collimonas arenae]